MWSKIQAQSQYPGTLGAVSQKRNVARVGGGCRSSSRLDAWGFIGLSRVQGCRDRRLEFSSTQGLGFRV